mgnify:CR=1 FL=1
MVQTNKTDLSGKIRIYQERVKNFIRRRVRSAEDVNDIVQEVMFQLAKADFLMQPVERLESWLFTVARNKITDWRRKKKDISLSAYYDDEDDEILSGEISDILFEDTETPEDEYLQSLVWQELGKALAELPEEQREAFTMTELEGMSFREMAQKTGVPENTLISRKRYAVVFLRKKLRALYSEIIQY